MPIEDPPRIQSVARAASILFEVAKSAAGLTVPEISAQTVIKRQTAYHLVKTLTDCGLLARQGDGRYLLGLRTGTLAEAFERHLAPAERLAPYVRTLSRATGETSYASALRQGEVVTLCVARGASPVQAAEVPLGVAEHAHARASGKLLLALAPEGFRLAYLERHPLIRRTDATLVDPHELNEEFARIREQGYSVDKEEFSNGLCCISVPVDGEASPFALAVSAPANRFEESFEQYLATLQLTASAAATSKPAQAVPIADGLTTV